MNKLKLGLAIASVGLLSACGGGGGDEDPAQNITLNGTVEVGVGEGAQITVSASRAVKAINPIDPDTNLTLDFSGSEITVTSAMLQSPALATYDVVMTQGNDTFTQRYEIMAVNTSAAGIEAKAYDIRDNYQALLDLEEDKEIFEYFVDLAYLREVISPAARDARIDDFDVSGEPSYALTQVSFDELVSIFDQYLDGAVGETTLEQYVVTAEDDLAIHSGAGLAHLRSVEDLSDPLMTPLPNADVVFVEAQGRYSRFFDAAMLTAGADSYTASYEILTPLTGL